MASRGCSAGAAQPAIAQIHLGPGRTRRLIRLPQLFAERCGPSCRYTAGKRNGETMTSKAVVLLSGGMDSCVTAAIAGEQHGAERLALVHASYGQRTEQRERRAFDDIAEFYWLRERLAGRLSPFTRLGGSAPTECPIA